MTEDSRGLAAGIPGAPPPGGPGAAPRDSSRSGETTSDDGGAADIGPPSGTVTQRSWGGHPGSAREVFAVFLRLGLTSFGGPVAHLGYFRAELVARRGWLGDGAYADLVALSQLLPGPASSKVGMGIGLHRAGMRGLLAAWAGFTLPSALALFAFAMGVGTLGDLTDAGWVTGLKVAAVAVVAHAVLGMARTLTPDLPRAVIGVLALALALAVPGPFAQVGAIVGAALVGLIVLRRIAIDPRAGEPLAARVSRPVALTSAGVLIVLLVLLPVLARGGAGGGVVGLFDTFYRAGALVFGGGHVVLPLLEAGTVQTGLVAPDTFLAGYGAAQAVPGPLFTFAAFLGAVTVSPPSGALGAAIALVAIFLPGVLLVIAAWPYWERLRTMRRVRRAIMGANAGVVGILAAALWDPVIAHGIGSVAAALLALAGFVALMTRRVPPWAVVVASALLGALLL